MDICSVIKLREWFSYGWLIDMGQFGGRMENFCSKHTSKCFRLRLDPQSTERVVLWV